MRGTRGVYRCSQGHLFSRGYGSWLRSFLIPRARLGFGVYTRCPVGHHWALVRWVAKSTLTEAEREALSLRERLDDRDDAQLALAFGLALGVLGVVVGLIVQTWWAALYVGVIIVCGAFLVRARRRETAS